VDGEEACLEIEILYGSDGGIAANGAEKRESERAQQGPLRCAMAGSLSPGFVGLSKADASCEWTRPQERNESNVARVRGGA